MRLSELVVQWSDVFDWSLKQILETEVLDVLKPHTHNLKKLEIMSYEGIEFPKWVTDPSFIRLTDVSIDNCRNCKFLPPLGNMPSLKKLCIESMDVKEVGSELLRNGPRAFPSLEILSFKKMPQWEVWSVNDVCGVVFPCLKELHVRNCPNMGRWEMWSTNYDVGLFPCLEKLLIYDCPNLVRVSLKALPSLRNLNVLNCGNVLLTSLISVASSITKLSICGISGLNEEELSLCRCKEIRNLWEISRCEKLVRIKAKKVEEEESNVCLPTSLRMLKIWDCNNLKHLSCPNSIETLEIVCCENLEYLCFPANSIQKLYMYGCSSITSVSFQTDRGGRWQRLKSLYIRGCNSELEKELEKQLIINNSTNIMSVLEFVGIRNWKDLKSMLFTCFNQLMKLEIHDCGSIESFPDLQDLVSLKHLSIWNCRGMDGPPPPLRRRVVGGGVWPPKLDSLEIGKLKRPISEWGPLPTSLIQVTLWGGFGSTEEEEHVKSFPTSLLPYSLSSSLTSLALDDFKKMERISEGLQHLTSLQHLSISSCPKMKDLPEMLLPSLLSLEIYSPPNEELRKKMMTRSGSYWPLLSHIPRVVIRY